MKWSQLKKRIECFLAKSVKGRVELCSTSYRRSHDQDGRGWILIDGHEILNMCTITYYIEHYQRQQETGEDYHAIDRELPKQNLFSQYGWHKSLFDYLNLSIDEILTSDNVLIRAIGMLDARTGKRRLKSYNIENEHDLVRRLYLFRCEAEGLLPASDEIHVEIPTVRRRKSDKNNRIQAAKKADEKMELSKCTCRIKSIFALIEQGKISEAELDNDFAKKLYTAIINSSEPERLFEILTFIERKSKLLQYSSPYVQGVLQLAEESNAWIRPLNTWKTPSHNPHKQFSSLARHLFAKYSVPLFMDDAWIAGNKLHQSWYIHLGKGKNIRTVDNFPIPLTKKCAHYFIQTPSRYSVIAAIRWGQIHALGGDQRLVDAFLESRLQEDFSNNEFWESVLRFFVRNPMLDTIHVGPIIDYIWNKKFEPRIIFVEDGIAQEAGPEQPEFSMHGRTVTALLQRVDRWHTQLGKAVTGGELRWEKSSVSDFKYVEGSQKSKNMKVWIIREILSSKELAAEGRQQKHCVATYAKSCSSGKCSIWTMDLQTEAGFEKLLTIELGSAENRVRQVRGKRNRRLTQEELDIIKRWAEQEELLIASYITGQA